MDTFDLDRIAGEASLGAIDFHDEVDSTNTRALDLVSSDSGASLSTDMVFPRLVLADRQRTGRGRGEHRWWAGTGALTFSVVVNAPAIQISTRESPLISLATGLAVAETLEEFGVGESVQLKWPNDVLLCRRKVCGILVESTSRRPGTIVVGIGVNVNNSFREAPAELQSTGISLVDHLGHSLERGEVLIRILKRMAEQFQALRQRALLADIWQQRCALHGRTIKIVAGSLSVAGVCQGIDNDGALLIQTDIGIERCYSGTVAEIA